MWMFASTSPGKSRGPPRPRGSGMRATMRPARQVTRPGYTRRACRSTIWPVSERVRGAVGKAGGVS